MVRVWSINYRRTELVDPISEAASRETSAMQADFISQPFDDGTSLFNFITEVGADNTVERFDVVVAWVKRSGLQRVRDELLAMRDRGVELRIIIGIDQGGATAQGLDMAHELFDDVYVFHDRSGRTFHPKVYFAVGPSAARALVGSHNLTAGGVYFNYEAGVRLALTSPEDDETIDSLIEYFERLTADDACLRLTDELLDELKNNTRYKIANEDASRKVSADGVEVDVDSEVDLEEAADTLPAESIFAKSAIAKAAPPPIPPVGGGNGGAAKKAAAKKAVAEKAAAAGGLHVEQAVVKRWFRAMDGTAAQHPPNPTTHPTHNLRLTLGRPQLPINKYQWHRHEMFGLLPWTQVVRKGEQVEVAEGQFRVIEMGVDRGVHRLEISHAPHREEGQNNIPTVLHWGTVEPLLAATNHTGRNVIIERLGDGTFRLEITADQPTVQDHIG